jgi:hypothetical protein
MHFDAIELGLRKNGYSPDELNDQRECIEKWPICRTPKLNEAGLPSLAVLDPSDKKSAIPCRDHDDGLSLTVF